MQVFWDAKRATPPRWRVFLLELGFLMRRWRGKR